MNDPGFPSRYEEALALLIVQAHDLSKMHPKDVHTLYLRVLRGVCLDKKDKIKQGVFFTQNGSMKL